jgi:replicative DNA helicase
MEPMEKLLPCSIEAEAAVLGSLIIDPDAIGQVEPLLKADDFYRDAHRCIYAAIARLAGRSIPADFITLCDLLEREGTLTDCGGASSITSLINGVPTSGNVEHYAHIVAQKALCRRLVGVAGQIAALAYDEVEDAAAQAEALVFAATQMLPVTSESHRVGDLLSEVLLPLTTGSPTDGDGAITGVPTGLRPLDEATGGLQPTDLILLAGRPGMGKSSLSLTIARHAAMQYGRTVLFFSVEMSRKQLLARLLSMEARVDLTRLWKRHLSEAEIVRLIEVSGAIDDAPLFIDDTSNLSISAMRSAIRRHLVRHPLDLIVVDYLQKLTATYDTGKRYADRVQEVSEVARGLKQMAREFGVPVLALAQLSRAVEGRAEKIPHLSDLRDSGELEQEADIVLFLYRDDYYAGFDANGASKSACPGTAEVIFAKYRNGPNGEIRLGFEARETRFYALEEA